MSTKAIRARNLRYKKPALASLGYEAITDELYDIAEKCDDVRWYMEGDNETLINALDGDEDEAFEFRMAFSELAAKTDQLYNALREWGVADYFDDCTVALVGNRYKTIGYDAVEEDYFNLVSYEQELAHTRAGKKLMRKTKPEIIATIGQCLGITIAFLDLRQQYDYLKATFDLLRDENTSLLKIIKDIDVAYDAANAVDFREWQKENKYLDMLVSTLPERTWLE